MFMACRPVPDHWEPYNIPKQQSSYKKIKCRITYYHPHQDKWGAKVACPKTKKAVEGLTVAAHPDFKFGQTVFIPELKGIIGDGHFTVQDRGSAVTKRTASKNQEYVFDVFVSNDQKMRNLARVNSEYMNVYIK